MNYTEALEYIHSLLRFGSKPGLERITELLSVMGNPQKDLKFIHVAGTNGKGSVCKMLSMIFAEAGLKVGLYISPYVVDFRERIQINGKFIEKDELSRLTEYTRDKLQSIQNGNGFITEFEFITALGFQYFKDCKCDIVILETGLGGRFDATNVIEKPAASVITKIDLEHTELLGDTIEKIAFEKAGIIKKGCPVITSEINPTESIDVFCKVCRERGSPIYLSDYGEIKDAVSNIDGNEFTYKGERYNLPIAGVNQQEDGSVVLKTGEVLPPAVSAGLIRSALKKSYFPARCEVISKDPIVILDGSHNPNGVAALSATLDSILHEKATAIVGFMADKNIDSALAEIINKFTKVITVTVTGNKRSISAADLCEKCLKFCGNCTAAGDYNHALKLAKAENTPIIVFGSLYLAGDIRDLLIKSF